MLEKNSLIKISVIALLSANLVFNEFLITGIAMDMGSDKTMGARMKAMMNKMFPYKTDMNVVNIVWARGAPAVYGAELNVSYDKIQESMDIMKQYDQDLKYGNGQIKLSGDKLSRYVKIGKIIACEFCCGAKTMVFDDGSAACGCAHSQAMRGLLAYLIEKHGAEYTDEQILHELAQWKGVYFPKQMVDKVIKEVNSGNYSQDIAALLANIDKEKLKASIKNSPDAAPASGGGAAPSQPLPGQQGGC